MNNFASIAYWQDLAARADKLGICLSLSGNEVKILCKKTKDYGFATFKDEEQFHNNINAFLLGVKFAKEQMAYQKPVKRPSRKK